MYIEEAYIEQQKTVDGTGKLTAATIPYLVFDALNEAEALAFAIQEVPKNLENLILLSASISERKSDTIFQVEVVYGVNSNIAGFSDDDDEPEATVNFECSTGSAHITKAISTRTLHGSINPNNYIGWNGKTNEESEISGVDIATATLRESYTKVMKVSKLSNSFRRKVAALVGKINSKSFKGWDKGEALFLGCSFSAPESGSEEVVVTFNFAIQISESMRVGSVMFDKKGWEYVWAITRTNVSSGYPTVSNEGVFASQVYGYADFGALGL